MTKIQPRSQGLPVTVPDLIEIKPDASGTIRMWIDGMLFPYGTISGYQIGEISAKQMPVVTVTIAAWRVTADHDPAFTRHSREQDASGGAEMAGGQAT